MASEEHDAWDEHQVKTHPNGGAAKHVDGLALDRKEDAVTQQRASKEHQPEEKQPEPEDETFVKELAATAGHQPPAPRSFQILFSPAWFLAQAFAAAPQRTVGRRKNACLPRHATSAMSKGREGRGGRKKPRFFLFNLRFFFQLWSTVSLRPSHRRLAALGFHHCEEYG